MRRFFVSRRPSSAMAVAFVALVAALSGTAIALPGKNTVDSGDIKNGQVKTKDIGRNAVTGVRVRNGALTGADARNNSLTGADINESSLGPVPSANAAANAGNAASAANADKLDGKDSSNFVSTDAMRSFFHRLSAGQTVTLLQHGTITIEAECLDNQTVGGAANQDAVRMLVSTSQNGALTIADDGDYNDGAGGDFLNTDTPVDQRELYVWRRNDGIAQAASNIDSLSVVDPNGRVITSFGGEGFVAGVNLLGSACYLGGTFLIIA
jgi:hypothetical protein